MKAGKSKNRKNKSQPSVGFQFNDQVIGGAQTFVTGDVESINQGLSSEEWKQINKLLKQFQGQVRDAAPEEKQTQAEEKVQELHTELSKGQNANPERLNKIIDGLVDMVPGAASAVATMFASPILGALVGPATKLVLDHIQK